MFSIRQPELAILNPFSARSRRVKNFPFLIGSNEGSDWRIESDEAETGIACLFQKVGSTFSLRNQSNGDPLRLDGSQLSDVLYLEWDRDYSLQVGRSGFLFRITKRSDRWLKSIDCGTWCFGNVLDGTAEKDVPSADLEFSLASHTGHAGEVAVLPKGARVGFFLEHMRELFRTPSAWRPGTIVETGEDNLTAAAPDAGELTCPSCWLHFDHGSVMVVAHHDNLRGDPVLGSDAKLRFYPEQFDDAGRPLDAMGLPCSGVACPHCRRKLPPDFLALPHHIFSIVGAPSAGKSYFLCVLLRELPRILFRRFGVTFIDGDPSRNARLNDMKNQLFGASQPEEAFIVKTDFEGVMYEQLPRYGKMVALPRPFVFNLRKESEPEDACALIFYDNAGEHFKPNVSMEDSPGALHVASSEAIFFLFDPASSPSFRKCLRDQTDSQLRLQSFDEQESILAEMSVRIKAILAYDTRGLFDKPLAIMVGKCDIWQHLLAEPLKDPVGNGVLDINAVQKNSAAIRELLMGLVPEIVANAEAASRNVVYFPVSAFGHSPVPIREGPLKGSLAPHPAYLSPVMIEAPILWAISHIRPNFVPAQDEALKATSSGGV